MGIASQALVHALKGLILMMTVGAPIPTDEPDDNKAATKRIGSRVKLARQIAGFDRREDFVEAVINKANHEMTEARMGYIERGESRPSFLDLVAIVITAEPPGGMDFFLPPLTEDAREAWERSKTRKL